ncbi:cytochrome c [Desulfonatronospira sp. MSAO_Bac3]|uniref:c-type cytochrome n=1 Tax=Desulfonatronospira sp. MSAO_Bac3 TaxID=2293857 RepID=UPI000FF86B3D|nr:cytochrome c [Desulfonatronospira sp. MSAO_Bac3]RQD78627.1 MAG: cytochrome c [Desulfonatronospira sp. MSAO_Bac3]
MRKLIILAMAGAIFATQVGIGLAMFDGNPRQGRFLFREQCRPCHMEDATKEGAAGEYLGPDAKRQAEWEEVFGDIEALPCYDEWDLSEDELNHIGTYLHQGAADSPSPERCG